MIKRCITALILLFVITAPVNAGDPQGGRESLFLLGTGVRAVGMGGAFTAVSNDASAIYWNPAGLASLQYRELSIMHVSLWEDTRYQFAGFAWPILDFGTIGAGGVILGTDNIEFRDQYGPLGEHDYSTGQYWVSYGRGLMRNLSCGVNLKVLSQSLGDYSSTTAAMDIGLLYDFRDFMSIGLNLQDILSGDLKLSQVEESIPYNIKGGVALRYFSDDGRYGVTAAGDVDLTEEQPAKVHLGIEAKIAEYIFARAGYDRDEITFGGGVKYKLAAFDYAYKDNEILGGTHRIGLSLFFGPSIDDQRAERADARLAEERARVESERVQKADSLYNQALDAFEAGDLENAEVLVNRALGFDPDFEEATQLLGNIRHEMSLREQEQIDQITSEQTRTKMIEDRLAAGNRYLEEGKLQEARAEFEAVIKVDPENETAAAGIASIESAIAEQVREFIGEGDRQNARGNYSDAIVSWNRALELDPGRTDIVRKIRSAEQTIELNQTIRTAVDAYAAGDTASARLLFNKILESDPENATALEYIKELNKTDIPVVPLEQLQADEEYWGLYLEGLKMFREKRYNEAIAIWERVLEKYPGSSETQDNIEQARRRLKE